MIIELIRKLFRKIIDPVADEKTERVVNIVWTKEEWWREGYDTNSVFRVIDLKHELFLLRNSEFVIEAVAAVATPLTCSLNKSLHKHGCYSAGDDEITEIEE